MLSFIVEDLGGGLVGMKHNNLMQFVGNSADDAVEEFSKLAKTQEGTSLVKLAKSVSNTCKGKTVCHIPNVFDEASKISESKKYSSRIIEAIDNDTAKVLEDIKLPYNIEAISELALNGKGLKFDMQFKGKTVEVRLMNSELPHVKGYHTGYPEGKFRIMDKASGNYYSADGSWLPDSINGVKIDLNRSKTHFHIIGIK